MKNIVIAAVSLQLLLWFVTVQASREIVTGQWLKDHRTMKAMVNYN